jgi:pyroglutamyl-peptidase
LRGGPAVRLLATGFGPFPGIERNVSAEVVLALPARLAGIEIAVETIPVDWAKARTIAREAVVRVKPHAVLHFGVAKRASGFEIETRAFNMCGAKRDHTGAVRPAGQLARAGAAMLPATLPPDALLTALRLGGFPALRSRCAGRYLCNAVYYWSLADSHAGGPLTAFVHMPAIGFAKSCLTLDQAIAGAYVLVRAAAQAVLCARRTGNRERDRHGPQGFHGAWRSGGGPAGRWGG